MNKPFIVSRNELTEAFVDAINKSDLDIVMIDMILKQFCAEISQLADRQAQAQLENWKMEQQFPLEENVIPPMPPIIDVEEPQEDAEN